MVKKYSVHKILLHYEPSRQLNECNKQLRELLPSLSEFHRMIVASWWCGAQPNIPIRFINSMMHKAVQFCLLMEVECSLFDFEDLEAAE